MTAQDFLCKASYEDQGVFLQGSLPRVTFRPVPANYQE